MFSRLKPEAEPDHAPRLLSPELYLNRELSWLAFNGRVLEEARSPRQALLERLKFAAIFSANLDEFFMVRISGLHEQIDSGVADRTPDGMTPAEELAAIRQAVVPALVEHRRLFSQELVPRLAEQGICIAHFGDLSPAQQQALRTYFEEEVFPVCTPLGLDPGHPFPLISSLSLNLAVVLDDPEGGRRFARVKVPSVLQRLVPVPGGEAAPAEGRARLTFVWLEEVLAANLGSLFPGMTISEVHPFRVIRDADIEIQELEAADLLETVEEGISRRRFNSVVAMMINPTMSDRVRTLLVENLKIDPEDVWVIDGPLGLSDLMELYGRVNRADLKENPFVARTPSVVRGASDLFAVIQQEDILLHHPYDSFGTVVDFIRSAALDANVLAIKQTLYRVGQQSPIVDALREAVDRGKQVAVLVELKARFDEENNIEWARMLEQAGVHVTYGMLGLKTHCKLALVVRRDREGLRRYVHIGTGNYNPATARLYTDFGLLTCNRDIGADVSDVFNYLTGYSKQSSYRKLLVAPVNLRGGLRERIEREITQHERTGEGRLIFKMNSLVDPDLIESLYRASQAGVPVDLIVRGICCLRPGVPGVSEHIRVRSVVGRFLEHSRVYYFHNGGRPEVFIGSADLMPRNLDHRVEVVAPVESEALKNVLVAEILQTYLNDNVQAWELQADGTYHRRQPEDDAYPLDAQATLLARALAEGEVGPQLGGTDLRAPYSVYGRVDPYE
jgi:polyphosphate kinase